MDFPNVPKLPGVPALLRVPPAAFTLVSRGLDGTADLLDTMAIIAADTPLAPISNIAGDLLDATTLMDGVTDTVMRYADSVMGDFLPQIGNINAGLGILNNALAATPSALLENFGGLLDSTAATADITSEAFDASQVDESGVLAGDSVTVTASRGGPQWGIFKDGKSVIKTENVPEIGGKLEWTISDYPIEEGGFESYNKVLVPGDFRVQFSAGGSLEKRKALLDSVAAIAGDLLLYDVVTPEKTYSSVNIVHYDWRRRSNNGLGLMIIDVYLEEVKANATAQFSTAQPDPDTASTAPTKSPTPAPKSPTASKPKNNGTVQAKSAPQIVADGFLASGGVL